VDADDRLRVGLRESRGDSRTDITAVRGVAIEAQLVAHEHVPQLMCLLVV
jgi:hypothetical protein